MWCVARVTCLVYSKNLILESALAYFTINEMAMAMVFLLGAC